MIVTGMLLGLIEVGTQRIFRRLLQVRVDGCVNPKTLVHRPIPTDRLNHFLPDVIDCVSLSLCTLPVAHDQVLRLRFCATLPIDKTKVAHPGEHDVARFPRR